MIQQDIVNETTLMLDSTSIKVHQHASSCKKGGSSESKGRSRGGITTKVHVVTDGLGNPPHFLLSRGNRSDIGMAQELLSSFDLSGKLVLADKGYDSDKLSDWIKGRDGITIIPSRRSARHPRKIDWDVYKERHLIENLFLKLKNYRRFSTRHEKKALSFHAVVSPCLYFGLIILMALKQALAFITKATETSVQKLLPFLLYDSLIYF